MASRADHTDVHFEDSCLSRKVLQGLATLWQDQKFTDVSLMVDGFELPCHRVVLAAASPYFNTMFASGFLESGSPTVEIRGADRDTLQTVVNCIYSAEITLTTENVQSLLQVSTEYQLNSLKEPCEKFMVQQLVSANCINYYKFARLFDLKKLQEKSRVVLLREFDSQSQPDLNELSEAELVELISDWNLHVPSEDAVFETVTSWVNADLENRISAFSRVLGHVRLPYCTDTFLNDVVKNEPLMTSDPICINYLEEAREIQAMPDHHPKATNKRKCLDVTPKLVVFGGEDAREYFHKTPRYLNERTGTWDVLAEFPLRGHVLVSYGVCVVQRGILVAGGYYGKHGPDQTDCWLFDRATNEWQAMPSMVDRRAEHALVPHWNQVYAIGGKNRRGSTDSVECLDLGTPRSKWREVEPMKIDVAGPLAVSFGQNIYVFGGVSESEAQGQGVSTQMYSQSWQTWTSKAEMPWKCISVNTAVTVDDLIYFVGGPYCMSYKPALDTWTMLSSSMGEHRLGGAVVWNGKILLGGGGVIRNRHILHSTDTIEEYDPNTGTWSLWNQCLDQLELTDIHMLRIEQ